MTNRSTNLRLGWLALGFSVFLLAYGIPAWVGAPRRVPHVVLSPLFWPNVLAVLAGLAGGLLLLSAYRDRGATVPENGPATRDETGLVRLLAVALLMATTMFLIPRLGMVWTSMLAFAALSLLLRTRYPRSALVCSVLLPLILYVFFAHAAGVAIPQGAFVRLP